MFSKKNPLDKKNQFQNVQCTVVIFSKNASGVIMYCNSRLLLEKIPQLTLFGTANCRVYSVDQMIYRIKKLFQPRGLNQGGFQHSRE